ncbi:MAG TPA: bifunctional diaminohydroxyphosphoribosylaminopyrimidine deaminase/5-amino-6-(5-phosphoribosylamino)uracil reductase RibD [Woeseiaceae bacterium]|nr:bifunctional diaminohydroxyphosphoribosylaminopyrimidine deaminase/5-amino-6-(5-phosphoribosylamino)uracil reductase RibD [Woeseiaceae bacterium]
MSTFTEKDCAYMAHALRLAERGRYTAHPNPVVGCVLVKNGRIVGEGFHQRTGAAHAEVNALHSAGGEAAGATAYVTLEPCAHHGKTPPCADALVEARVAKVVVAMMDPNHVVAGKGLARLTDAGIDVKQGLMADVAANLNRGFLKRVSSGRPFVRVKVACSIDGAIAMANGESQWITGPEARNDVQRLRARSGAVMTGIGTVLADDPSLNVRDSRFETGGLQPLRVVLDSGLRMPQSARMLTLPGQTLICCVRKHHKGDFESSNVEVMSFPERDGRVDVDAVLAEVAIRGVNELLVEAGPELLGNMLDRRLLDELVVYQAPLILGSETRRMADTPGWTALRDRRELQFTDVRRIGRDLRLTATLATQD